MDCNGRHEEWTWDGCTRCEDADRNERAAIASESLSRQLPRFDLQDDTDPVRALMVAWMDRHYGKEA